MLVWVIVLCACVFCSFFLFVIFFKHIFRNIFLFSFGLLKKSAFCRNLMPVCLFFPFLLSFYLIYCCTWLQWSRWSRVASAEEGHRFDSWFIFTWGLHVFFLMHVLLFSQSTPISSHKLKTCSLVHLRHYTVHKCVFVPPWPCDGNCPQCTQYPACWKQAPGFLWPWARANSRHCSHLYTLFSSLFLFHYI